MAPFEEINIPQKPPMVMVDRIVDIVDKETVTVFRIMEDNIFIENGELTEAGMIENMAQTAAAGNGAKPGISQGEPPMGFIGGIRSLKIRKFPKIGEEIRTQVKVLHEVLDATIAQGEIFLDHQLIAECELKIFLIKK